MTTNDPGVSTQSSAGIVLDDRAYAAWSHIALDRAVGSRTFGVKDVIDVIGMPTSCGFEPWRDRIATQDAVVVRRLRAAGWDPVGKTHTAQFAYADPPPTLNPMAPSRTPGGSSTGSAVAVARGHVAMALGTQTGGSTIRPAAYCGVTGMKPSFGVVPVDGIHPVAPSLDTIGIIAASVAVATDAAHAMGAIDDAGLRVAMASGSPRTIAMFDDVGPLHQDAAASTAWRRITKALDGVMTRSVPLPPIDLDRAIELHVTLMAVEAWPYHAERFTTPESRYYGAKMRMLLERGRDLAGRTRSADQLGPLRSELQGLGNAVPDDGVLLMPATIGSPPDRHETGSSRLCMPWTALGLPVVVVPWRIALAEGEPQSGGVQVIGQWGCDDVVLSVASDVERQLHEAGLLAVSQRMPWT